MLDLLGWIATLVFAASYFVTRPDRMRYVQALASLLWIGYGVILKAPPVIVANVIVAVLAIGSSFRQRAATQS